MDTAPQVAPGYYIWEAPDSLPEQRIVIHLNLNIIDSLSAEVMRGFGAVPKRGAEIGGVLFGTVEEGAPTIIRVEDFETVPCQYRRGPSYLFTEEDAAAYETAAAKPGAIGYFRSHTREGLSLAEEDIELLDGLFPRSSAIALLVKPFATKVSIASFFVRENGAFSTEAAPSEFPFRRRELSGEEPAPRRPLTHRQRVRFRRGAVSEGSEQGRLANESTLLQETAGSEYGGHAERRAADLAGDQWFPEQSEPAPEARYASLPRPNTPPRGIVWIPLSIALLLAGVFMGFEGSAIMKGNPAGAAASQFSLSLSVAANDENLSVRWDRGSQAVQVSERGLLEIDEGGRSKSVELDKAQLENGTLLYRTAANSVRFRLSVFPTPRVAVVETVDWKR